VQKFVGVAVLGGAEEVAFIINDHAVEVSSLVKCHRAVGKATLGTIGEIVKCLLFPTTSRRESQLEDPSLPMRAP
jgi:hypothetical protein